jgi:hypothetical protein
MIARGVALALAAWGLGIAPAAAQQTRPEREAANVEQRMKSYVCSEQELMGRSTEGGTLRTCYDGERLRVAIATYYGETGRATERYFFSQDGALLVVACTEDQYTGYLSGKVRSSLRERFVFDAGRLIRWSDSRSGRRSLGSSEARERQRTLTAFADSIASAARAPKRARPQ